MWISGGDHDLSENIVHLVLAKIPGGPPGVKGISLFIVPRFLVEEGGTIGERNDVVVAGLNHKMGYRGTVNTLLNFGEGAYTPHGKPGAVGYLVGEAHRGLAYMFHMMNEARVGIGIGAAALGCTAYLKSLRVRARAPPGTSRRRQGSVTAAGAHHPARGRASNAPRTEVVCRRRDGARPVLQQARRRAQDRRERGARAQAGLLLEVLTPIAKSWPSQWCLAANDLAIQIHGGYGYTRDFDVEQHYRDNRLNPIHEGTAGIQALDLLGRKVVMDNGSGLELWADVANATLARAGAAGGEVAELAGVVKAAVDRVILATRCAWNGGDVEATLAQATPYLEAMGHVVVAWLWIEQWLAAEGRAGAFYDGKRHAARYFVRCELPSIGPRLDMVERLDRTALDMREAWF